MDNKKECYRSQAVVKKNPKQTFAALVLTAVTYSIVFIIANVLPASWFFQIAGLLFVAIYINKVLKQGTFATTYILYEDTLTVVTRYGLIEKVTGEYLLEKAHFTDSYIEYDGRRESFYPDEKLKKLLKIQTTS